MQKNSRYMTAASWLLLLIFFTYTPIWGELINANGCVFNKYFAELSGPLNLFVNFGLLAMVIFDCLGAKRQIKTIDIILLLVAFVLVFVIYQHACAVHNKTTDELRGILSWAGFSPTAHFLYLLIIYYFKVKSLERSLQPVTIKKEF